MKFIIILFISTMLMSVIIINGALISEEIEPSQEELVHVKTINTTERMMLRVKIKFEQPGQFISIKIRKHLGLEDLTESQIFLYNIVNDYDNIRQFLFQILHRGEYDIIFQVLVYSDDTKKVKQTIEWEIFPAIKDPIYKRKIAWMNELANRAKQQGLL